MKFLKNSRGQSITEYMLILSLSVVAATIGLEAFGHGTVCTYAYVTGNARAAFLGLEFSDPATGQPYDQVYLLTRAFHLGLGDEPGNPSSANQATVQECLVRFGH